MSHSTHLCPSPLPLATILPNFRIVISVSVLNLLQFIWPLSSGAMFLKDDLFLSHPDENPVTPQCSKTYCKIINMAYQIPTMTDSLHSVLFCTVLFLFLHSHIEEEIANEHLLCVTNMIGSWTWQISYSEHYSKDKVLKKNAQLPTHSEEERLWKCNSPLRSRVPVLSSIPNCHTLFSRVFRRGVWLFGVQESLFVSPSTQIL